MDSRSPGEARKVKLIPDWRRAWRFFSVQAMVLAAAIQGAWATLPPEMISTIPDGVVRSATFVLMVLGTVGRLVDQKKDET